MARAYLTAGHRTTVWNRSPEKADPLVARGAARAESVVDAIDASTLVVACVTDYEVFHSLVKPVGERLAGKTLVNLTNGTPGQARQAGVWAEEWGVDYLDGGIMAVPPGIGQPGAFVLYAGAESVFHAHRPELEVLGAATYVGADAGLASLYDLALLSGMYGLFGGALHAFTLVGTQKVSATEFLSLLGPWLEAMATLLPDFARRIDEGEFDRDVDSPMGMQAVALENIVNASQEQGINPELLDPIRRLANRLVREGGAAQDTAALARLLTTRTVT